MQELRANTQVKVIIGPAVAVGDGFTPVTTLDLSTADEAELFKHDAAAVTSISAATFAAITSADGYYNLTLTTSLTDTEGLLTVCINDDSLILPIMARFMVLSEAAWDSKYVAKDDGFMDVNIKTIGRADTQETEATNLEAACAAYSATRGLTGTALPAAAADAAGGLPISDAGGLDLDAKIGALTFTVANTLNVAVTHWIATAVATPTVAGVPEVDVTHMIGTTANTSLVVTVADGYVSNGVFAARLEGWSQATETIGATGNDTTHLHLANYSFGDDEINNQLITILDVSTGELHSRWVEDWVASTKLATVATLPFTPQDNTDIVYLFPVRRDALALSSAGVTAVQSGLATSAAQTTAQNDLDILTGSDGVTLATSQPNYAPGTAAELAKVPKSDSNVTWNATALASINTQADTALADYDGPTNAEMVAAFTEIKGATWATTDTLEAIRDRGDAAWTTATGFSTHSAADVWSSATRTLTAGTNIQLPSNGLANVTAWTVNITGNLSGSVGSVTGAVGSVTGAVGSVTGNVGGSVGSVTGGINTAAGVITTLDALDTAQDTQHGTTQTAVADLPTNAELATALGTADDAVLAAITSAHSTTDALITTVDTVVDGIAADLPARITKNVALANFMFKMVDATDHVTAETGLTITATRSLDGAAFAACANAASEVASGWYKIDLDAADLNANVVVLRFTGTGADTNELVIVTQNT